MLMLFFFLCIFSYFCDMLHFFVICCFVSFFFELMSNLICRLVFQIYLFFLLAAILNCTNLVTLLFRVIVFVVRDVCT